MPDTDARALQEAFARHLRDPERYPPPEGLEDRRLAIYRRLFINNVAGLLGRGFPVLRRTLTEDPWLALVRDFYRDHGCHTPYFPQLGNEFVSYLTDGRPAAAGDPPFLAELAHYERVETELFYADEGPAEACDPEGDVLADIPVFSPAARLLAYGFPVHRIGPEFRPQAPGDSPTLLLACRAPDDRIRFAELNPLGARLLWRIIEEPAAGHEQIRRVAGDFGLEATPELTASGRELLTHYRGLGAILGTRPTMD
ncbi:MULTISPECIES: DUF2063 domain-containing protein [unclassified Thioalkalivibrio]|uniref:HvfC family RiPP maturation protein n=1 Tax=unclassified Thioalkalivibrio TaxID=2621013 RepID=UPI0003769C75|nr:MULTISPECIES: putative DNA-binding domain-containing protein [unclassified Thioalkalivibrio]